MMFVLGPKNCKESISLLLCALLNILELMCFLVELYLLFFINILQKQTKFVAAAATVVCKYIQSSRFWWSMTQSECSYVKINAKIYHHHLSFILLHMHIIFYTFSNKMKESRSLSFNRRTTLKMVSILIQPMNCATCQVCLETLLWNLWTYDNQHNFM